MTGVLTGREEDTGERSPREDRGRDWGDVATSQGLLGATRNGKREGRMLPWSAEGAWLWRHRGFRPTGEHASAVLATEVVQTCSSSHGNSQCSSLSPSGLLSPTLPSLSCFSHAGSLTGSISFPNNLTHADIALTTDTLLSLFRIPLSLSGKTFQTPPSPGVCAIP